MSTTVATEKGIRDYLILLSICETCKCKGVSFLDFLRSGEKDIDVFADSKCRRAHSKYASRKTPSHIEHYSGVPEKIEG